MTQHRADSSVGVTDLDNGEPGRVEFLSDRVLVQATLERTEQIIDELELRLRERCPVYRMLRLKLKVLLQTTQWTSQMGNTVVV